MTRKPCFSSTARRPSLSSWSSSTTKMVLFSGIIAPSQREPDATRPPAYQPAPHAASSGTRRDRTTEGLGRLVVELAARAEPRQNPPYAPAVPAHTPDGDSFHGLLSGCPGFAIERLYSGVFYFKLG